MPLYFAVQDITKMKTDAIVNAANTALQQGGGVCGAIFRAAGAQQLQAACSRWGGCPTGQAVITGGFQLPAKYVIHAVGPIYQPGNPWQAQKLYDCYRNSLLLAEEFHCRSVAFPLISTGVYGYPKQEAVQIAVTSILQFLAGRDMDVYLCILDPEMMQLAASETLKWSQRNMK